MPHTSTDSTHLENIEVTLYSDVLDKLGGKRTIDQCLDLIRADTTLSQKVTQLRSLYRKADELRQSANGCEEANNAFEKAKNLYDNAKRQLPAFTFSGTFTKRGIAGLETYTGIIQVDLDHLNQLGFEIDDLKKRLKIDPFVVFAFVSPSGDGLKIGVRVDTGAEHHEAAFLAMQCYFETTYGIRPDDKCKDVSRLCFLSSDPDIWINPAPVAFDWRAWPAPAVEAVEDEEEDTHVPLPLDAFPPVMEKLATSCAEVFQVDPALAVVSALTIMAAASGKSVECTGAVNGRITPCNLFTVISAPPSYGKTVAGVVARPLIEASVEMSKHFENVERPKLRADIAVAEGTRKKILNDLKNGDLTAEEARKQLGPLEAEIERWNFEASLAPCLYTGSATGPALGVALKRNDEQLLSFALEAGDAIRVTGGRFTSDNRGDYDLFLSGYTVEPYSDARISRNGLRLVAPCLCFLWAVQPMLLRELYGTAEAQERGLLARINVVPCDDDIIPLDDGIEREVPAQLTKQWSDLVRDALDLRKSGRKVMFRASTDARQIFRRFNNEAVAIRNGDGRENEAKLMRCRENAIRIALVIAATEWLAAGAVGDAPVLTAEHAARGVVIAQYFLANTLNLTRAAVMEAQKTRLAQLLGIVAEAGGSITLRRLRDHHNFGEAEVNQIVERNADKLEIKTAAPGAKGGRPSHCLVAKEG